MLAATHYSSLTTLRIGATDSPLSHLPSALQAVTRVLQAQTALEHLYLDDFQWRFQAPFKVAARLPNLLTASFTENDCDFCPFENNGPVGIDHPIKGFRSLLSMKAELTANTIPHLLASIHSKELNSLQLLIQVEETMSRMQGVLADIAKFSQLKVVHIVYAQTKGTWRDFVALLSCSQLEKVTLKGFRASLVFTDLEVAIMGRAWHRLRELEIEDLSRLPAHEHGEEPDGGEMEDAFYAPKVTLAGLANLSKDCTELRRLKIAIDATILPTHSELSKLTPSLVEDINFPCSYVDEREDDAARVIARLWPAQRTRRPKGGCWHSWWYDPYNASEGAFVSLMGRRWERIWTNVVSILVES